MASVALDLRMAGRFRESVNLLRATRGKYQEILGDDMLDTLRDGQSRRVAAQGGEQADALNLGQDTYQRYQRPIWQWRAGCSTVRPESGAAHAVAGDTPRALDLVSAVRGAYLAGLGDDHPYTLVAGNNLA